jgi:hypothetical protein
VDEVEVEGKVLDMDMADTVDREVIGPDLRHSRQKRKRKSNRKSRSCSGGNQRPSSL